MLSDGEIRRRLGQKIRHLRLRQDFTQVSLAEQAQVSLTTLKRIEKGDISYFDSLMRVLRILGELDVFSPLIKEDEMSPNNISSLSRQAKRSSANAQAVTTRPTHNLIPRNQNGRYSKSKPVWPTRRDIPMGQQPPARTFRVCRQFHRQRNICFQYWKQIKRNLVYPSACFLNDRLVIPVYSRYCVGFRPSVRCT